MVKSLFKSLVAFAACLYLGGSHLAVLQIVAWTGMLVTYSADEGLATGLKDTFSGEKPCPMCKAITAIKQQEAPGDKKSPAPPKGFEKRWQEMLPAGDVLRPRPLPASQLPIGFASVPGLTGMDKSSPPVPPPRILV
jgi:hypothetical protein